jgi:long-chain acyl-CoA synthetase
MPQGRQPVSLIGTTVVRLSTNIGKLIRSPDVFANYWNDPAATEQSLKGGWYFTGDLMRRSDDNDLWFVSRKRGIIIRGGANISPIEVEDALVASHPGDRGGGCCRQA